MGDLGGHNDLNALGQHVVDKCPHQPPALRQRVGHLSGEILALHRWPGRTVIAGAAVGAGY